eukprot:3866992-Alexandrium_andersonii.AAC.1
MAPAPGVLILLRVACAARTDAFMPRALGAAGRLDTCQAHAAEPGTSVHTNLSFCDHRVLVSGATVQGGPTPNSNQCLDCNGTHAS